MAIRVLVDGVPLDVDEIDEQAWRDHGVGTCSAPLPAVPVLPPRRVCAGCDAVWQPDKTGAKPFCGLACKDAAKTVRCGRGIVVDHGRLDAAPQDVQEALGVKLAHAISGGCDAAARRLPRSTREQVFARDHSRCVLCGSAGEEIDNISGPSLT